MILGIGTDIVEVKRFKKWVSNPAMINRFFNKEEQGTFSSDQRACEHYAVRFAAKESFGKALGVGLVGFNFTDVYVRKDHKGKPELVIEDTAKKAVEEIYGNCKIHLSLSHEKEYATAFVVIESI
ncbi:MAG: holo-ACP synthase [Treponema sp.]|nr:holo-ACP synthase [Spirochaetia bacterium]MDY2839035.1 holo-ACP synthase [Treponema sp.]MDY5123275.1 holo-ACP synthase [Treponema sp.]